MAVRLSISLCAMSLFMTAVLVGAQRPTPSPPAAQPMRKASDLIRKQEPVKVNQSLLKEVTPDAVHVVVSLPKQRAYLMTGEQIVIDSPISSGKRGHTSPTGHLQVLDKDQKHRASLDVDSVDTPGSTVRAGVSARIDAAPSGTRFAG